MEGFEFLAIPEKFSSLDIPMYQYFHQLLNNRTIVFNSDVDENIVEAVYLPLKDFENDESNEPVTLVLNSSGGSVSDGFFLAHYLTSYKKKLNIIVTGYACSMATVLLAAGGKNDNITRKAYKSSYFLCHDGYIAIAASEVKTANDLLSFNNKVDGDIRDFIISNTNITQELYDSKSRKQWFITAVEAKELNLIDEIME